MSQLYKLSPSDLTFLWDECKRCFYLKVVRDFRRPSAPFPKIFSRIDILMKDYYLNKSTLEISPDLLEGTVFETGKWVESTSIRDGGLGVECYIKGIFDTVLKFDDDSYAVVDFKTTVANEDHLPFYARQLWAYAYALEHGAPTKLSLKPIQQLGLLCFEPRHMDKDTEGRLTYRGPVIWQPIQPDEPAFLAFIAEILKVLALSEPPPAGEKCEFCKYREQARINNL